MEKPIEFGIGFVTGRPMVCKIINSYYLDLLEQIERYDKKVNVTFFILYDLEYQSTQKEDFYDILPEVYQKIHIQYITSEDILEEKKKIRARHSFTEKEVDHILGYGHAKGRNTVMYYALEKKMDYLLFWDDDEYPVACVKNKNDTIEWKKQDNVLQHLKHLGNGDISIGYHCRIHFSNSLYRTKQRHRGRDFQTIYRGNKQ